MVKKRYYTQEFLDSYFSGHNFSNRLSEYNNFRIIVTVGSLHEDRARAIELMSDYDTRVRAALPQEANYGKLSFHLQVDTRPVKEIKTKSGPAHKDMRVYQLDATIHGNSEEKKQALRELMWSFLYPNSLNRLYGGVKVKVLGQTTPNLYALLDVEQKIPRNSFRTPVNNYDPLTKYILKQIFASDSPFPIFLADQLVDRHPFVKCIRLEGDAIGRRYTKPGDRSSPELDFSTPEKIVEFFQTTKGVEYHKSVDRISTGKVDTLTLELDPGEFVDRTKNWSSMIRDLEVYATALKNYGVNSESIEVNFSGRNSPQFLVHLNSGITHDEARRLQIFNALYFVYNIVSDRSAYSLDIYNGPSRVRRTLVDYSYGYKKEIKCATTPNISSPPVHCATRLLLEESPSGLVFEKGTHDFAKIKQDSSWETVAHELLSQRRYAFQRHFEKHATSPTIFEKIRTEHPHLVEAVSAFERRKLKTYEFDFLDSEELKRRLFSQQKLTDNE